ncbi:MAG: hypothetical protein KBF37_04445 [Saprospiraceae bacterium]|jgi:streptogramin lyase|nr:hypothetical protein [Saprospiraceae bacterium]MBP9209555.1 hypothetical protein [Saprospiraceae bacterium]
MKRFTAGIAFAISTVFSAWLCGQSQNAIGEWSTHLPYNAGNWVADGGQFVYFATGYGILRVHATEYSFERISRTEGLSGTQIVALGYHQESSQLAVAYADGLVDLFGQEGVYPVPDLLLYDNVPIDKSIHRIRPMEGNGVLISGNYGVSQLDVVTRRFLFTLFTPNLAVYDCMEAGTQLYMATEGGLYRFDRAGGGLAEAFSSWTRVGAASGLPDGMAVRSLALYDGDVYACTSQTIYRASPGQDFSLVYADPAYEIKYLRSGPTHLLAGLRCRNACPDQLARIDPAGAVSLMPPGCADQNLDAVERPDGSIWLADQRWSFRFAAEGDASCNGIWVNGPLSNRAWEVATLSDGVYVAMGGVDATFTPNYITEGIARFSGGSWTSINSSTEPGLAGYALTDVLRIAETNDRSRIYFASAGKGLLQYDRNDNRYTLYGKQNSPLQGAVGDSNNVRLSGLAIDRNNTLWITNYLAPVGLLSLDPSGTWREYKFPNNSNLFTEVKVDRNGYKWIVSRVSGGVTVFDEGDPDNPSDDRRIQLTNSNTEMTTNDVRTVEVDLDGDVWVGTAQGPVVFECGASIFSGSCKGVRRKVDQDGIIYFLLASEVITSIAVDGANRKWFGTSDNGVYVQSPSGENQIYHFNASNSPLLDNAIQDIAIDPVTGEAWIATASGLQVFRAEATLAKDYFSEVPRVFPNPVPPDYDGPIAIRGLPRDARFKVTDLSGRLVYEDFAYGGQAIWFGKDYLGRKVASGVYLVFANTTRDFETSEGAVAKVVIVR